MKLIVSVLFLLIPCIAAAQNYQGMSEQDMQKMMEQMQKMQTCMQDVDQAELKKLEERSKKFEAEVKSLCASGKRDEAQERAISFGREIAKDPEMQKMRECGEMMKGMMPKMPVMEYDQDYSSYHVCDN